MKVYLATAGVYSDYRVVAVFSKREDAEELVKRCRFDDGDVEEYDLDPPVILPEDGFKPFSVMFSGDRVYCDETTGFFCPTDSCVVDALGFTEVLCWARDKKHARKLASEILARHKVASDVKRMAASKGTEA